MQSITLLLSAFSYGAIGVGTASCVGLSPQQLTLIPFLGSVGAAFATLLSEVVLCISGLSLISRMGYERVGQRIGLIAAISLLATALPSLMLNGLSSALGAGVRG